MAGMSMDVAVVLEPVPLICPTGETSVLCFFCGYRHIAFMGGRDEILGNRWSRVCRELPR